MNSALLKYPIREAPIFHASKSTCRCRCRSCSDQTPSSKPVLESPGLHDADRQKCVSEEVMCGVPS